MIPLDYTELSAVVDVALEEDIGHGDLTTRTLIPADNHARFTIIAKEDLALCGQDVISCTLEKFNTPFELTLHHAEGTTLKAGEIIAEGSGHTQTLLTAERVLLNCLQFTSAIATTTQRYVEAVSHTSTRILDTRKTLPGLRLLQKYAVRVGGGHNHRLRLDDGVMIKDNHIALYGSLTNAIAHARHETPHLTRIEVECDTLTQVEEALQSEVDVILLDNMSTEILAQAVALNKGRKILEASGGIDLKRIPAIAETGVDYISIGKLTREIESVDISLELEALKD